MKKLVSLMFIVSISIFSLSANAEEEEPQEQEDQTLAEYAYYGFEPEIVTNYLSSGRKLGFVRISVELMVKSPEDLVAIEHHDPLLRAAIIEILGSQTSDKVKSLTGREEIRRECYEALNRLIEQETGQQLIVNMLFTKYLYD
ncbi:flagellar basal body-associated protein FliL [Shewanella sp. D64]|uniref:flagellar basal body-associated protein FliL n=1 Tax=unclassified Shewanella TaxID=196818 RepID=UPI0022BA42AA|nr:MULTISPECIES: flagellar basal body-associated protein FliL [unclassified Shewanella]MEC4726278.1 flagellar basal body-associated protein FliL [Shewanella sp. D64]MEC4738290.1 flagellar basal body-associated protein FliL [Shewanella sp. E94]WBJ98315.1 flagellar basal body-associated protein FliL [Shewanella sp. MTB7]